MFIKRKVRFDRMRKKVDEPAEKPAAVEFAAVQTEEEFFAQRNIQYRRGKL